MADVEEIERRLQRLELVLKGTGLGLWDWNPQTGAVTFDERWCQMLGYELHEITPNVESWSSRVHPQDIDQCFADITAHIEGRAEFYTNTHRMKHKDGSWRYILDRGQVMERDYEGRPIRFTGSHEDVTEKVTASKALEWKERVLNATQKIANIGSFNTHINSDKQWYSIQLRAIFGYSADEHFDRDLWIKHVHPEDVEEVTRATTEIFTKKVAKTSHLTYRIIKRQGEMRWIEVTWTYDFDEQGEIKFIEGSVQDITEKHEIQAQQLEFERGQTERFRQLSSTLMSVERVAKIGSWSITLEENTLVWSDETRRIHEVAEDYTPTVDTAVLFYEPGENRERILKALETAVATGEGWDLELALITAKGNRIWVRAQGETEFVDGKCVRLFGALQDISQRHYQEEALREANAKAERASQMKSEFLANMSHEIRTPMNAVLGLAQILTRTNKYSHEVVEQAKKIMRAGQSLQNLLNDILDFSKIESGKLTLCKMPIRLVEMQENLSLLMGNSARDKQIELIIEPLEAPELSVIADQLRLEQILINLIGNAIKFTESGYVSLRITSKESRVNPDQIELTFQVTDTGIGISEEQHQRILEPFAQADSSITRRFGGTGLGLAISQRLLGLMGSTLSLQSTFGIGTVASFSIVLERAQAVRTDAHHPLSTLDVLVVDDHKIARDAICRTAKSLGWKAIPAPGGLSAVEHYKESIARGEQIDLILMDWMMPDVDGTSAAKQIKEHANSVQARHAPTIIMVTAYAQEQVERSPHVDCIDLIIHKPVTIASLRNAYIALEDKQMAKVNHPLGAGSIFDGKTLLIVDDSLYNRDVAQMIFEAEGAHIAIAEDGQQAINWLQNDQNHADVVLMDVQMPVLDGLDAAATIRKQARFASLPIIAMSAGAYQADVDKALSVGMNAYITKPIDVESAVRTVAEQIGVALDDKRVLASAPKTGHKAAEKGSRFEKQGALALFDAPAAVRFWGTEARVAGYLQQFISDFNAAFDRLNSVKAGMNLADLHRLKGAAGTLYLNRLVSALQAAENSAKTGTHLDQAALELSLIWKQTESLITQLTDQYIPPIDKPNQLEQLARDIAVPKESLRNLYEALDSYDPDEVEAVLGPLLKRYPCELLTEVELAVIRFDFEGAQSYLNPLIKPQ